MKYIRSSGLLDRLHVRLHSEVGVQVRVRGEGRDEGLRHVHPLQVASEELDLERPGGIARERQELLEAALTKCSNGFDSFTFLHRGSSLKYLSSSTPEPFTSIFTFQPKEIL